MNAPAPGDLIASGKYRLERPLARGGMGTVFVARHLQLDVLVAVKFIDAAMAASNDARVRFEREAKAAAQIRNPNVVQIFDHGVDGGVPYIVMELLEGEDLGARLRREKRQSLSQTVSIMNQVAKGLRRAHESGIVHRDLKPGNLFMARVEEEEIVKILDFGLAKAFSGSAVDEMTVTGIVLGSPHYMSPEQARGVRQLDHRSDIWSLGIILYRCLTGTIPFQGEQMGDLVVKICTEPFRPPSHLVPDLPPQIDGFFERALARDLDKRFQSVREMAAELTAIVTRPSAPDLPGPLSRPSPESLSVPPQLPPLSTPLPGPLSWPAGDQAAAPMVTPFRDPLGGPASTGQQPFLNLLGRENTFSADTTTVPAMVPATPASLRRPSRPVLLGVAGVAFGLVLAVGWLVSMGGASKPPVSATASPPEASALPRTDTPAPQASSISATAATTTPAAKDAEPGATIDDIDELDEDAGAAPTSHADASARPTGPVKKKRNFGY